MIDSPQIVSTSEQLTARLHCTVAREEIRTAMDGGVHEILAALTAQGIAPTGPWFTHHLRRPSDTFDFEICFPVAEMIQPSGWVTPGRWPAMTVARTVYHGNYSGLPAAWGEFHAWLDTNSYKTAEDLWEVYLVNPESSPNPADWRTQLNRPLVD